MDKSKSATQELEPTRHTNGSSDEATAIRELARLAGELSAASNPSETYRAALAGLARLIHAEFLSVTMQVEGAENNRQRLCATLESVREFSFVGEGETVRVQHTMLEHVLHARAPVIFNDAPDELVSDALVASLVCPAAQSILCAPLITNSEVTGFITASVSRKDAYTDADRDRAEIIAHLLAMALARIETARSFASSRTHDVLRAQALAEDLHAWMNCADSADNASDLAAIVQRTANALARVLPAINFVLLREVSFNHTLPLLRAWTPGTNRPPLEIHAPAGQTERAVYTEQRPVLIENIVEAQGVDANALLPLVERLGASSACFAPIVYNGQTLAAIGIVCADAKINHQLTNNDRVLLAHAAELIAPLISSAQLRQSLSIYTEDLLALLRLACEVTDETQLDLTLRAVLDSWSRITSAEASAILRWDDEAQHLRLAAAKHLPAGVLERYTQGITLEDSLCGLAAQKRTGVAADLASDRNFAELYNAVRWSNLRGAWATPITEGASKLFGMLVMFSQSVSEVRPVEQRLADLFMRPVVIAMQNLDAHQQQRREAQTIKRMEEQLGHAARHKAEFMSVISHELRTPLNSIIGFAEMLRQGFSGDLNEQQSNDVQTISTSAETLLCMVEDTLDLARIDTERFPVYMDNVAFADVVKRAIAGVRADAETKGLDIELDIAADAPAVRTDPERVRQILARLLSNAIKFTEHGFVRISVRAGDGGHVQVDVSDTGVGFDTQAFPQAFDEFYQADSSNTRAYGGTGLGLAVSKRLVQRLGGHIGVTSRPGEGSTFWFQLPPEIPGTDA